MYRLHANTARMESMVECCSILFYCLFHATRRLGPLIVCSCILLCLWSSLFVCIVVLVRLFCWHDWAAVLCCCLGVEVFGYCTDFLGSAGEAKISVQYPETFARRDAQKMYCDCGLQPSQVGRPNEKPRCCFEGVASCIALYLWNWLVCVCSTVKIFLSSVFWLDNCQKRREFRDRCDRARVHN